MIGSRPFFSALPWKMSAQLVVMTAWIPHATSAHGACSRDDPQPKLTPASRILRPYIWGLSRTNVGSFRPPSASYRQSRKSASARPSLSVTFRNRAGTIWSVSMFSTGRGMTALVKLVLHLHRLDDEELLAG